MTSELKSWERKESTPGGGDPFLFYVVFGKVDLSVPLSPGAYRSNGIPDGIDVMSYGPDTHPEVPASFLDGYLWHEFMANDPDCAAQVADCEQCIALSGMPTDATTLNYFRDTNRADYIYARSRWLCCLRSADDSLVESRRRKQAIFDPAGPVPRHHVIILVSEEDSPSLNWFHTRGMRKFGRPDISVHNVPKELESEVIDLCNRVIEHQAFGLVVPDGQEVRMACLPCGGVIRHAGNLDDPDFNNVHLDVSLVNVG